VENLEGNMDKKWGKWKCTMGSSKWQKNERIKLTVPTLYFLIFSKHVGETRGLGRGGPSSGIY
jgi:hypothetical protein